MEFSVPYVLKPPQCVAETNEKLVDASQNGSLVYCLDYSPFTICFYNVNINSGSAVEMQ